MAAAVSVLVLCLLAAFGRAFEHNTIELSSVLGCGVHVLSSEATNVTELRCNVRTLHDQLPIINPSLVSVPFAQDFKFEEKLSGL